MSNYNHVIEKLIFSYPVMFILYLSINNSFNFEKNSMLNNFILNLGYRIYKTVPESCSFGDISDNKFCRNHIYIPFKKN